MKIGFPAMFRLHAPVIFLQLSRFQTDLQTSCLKVHPTIVSMIQSFSRFARISVARYFFCDKNSHRLHRKRERVINRAEDNILYECVFSKSAGGPLKRIHFLSKGTKCAGWHYESEGSGACVVMAHGFGAVKEMALSRYASRFHEAGHDVLIFDYRNFGESEGKSRQVIDIRSQLEDWEAAIAYVRTLPSVKKIILWGTSFSGGHVIQLSGTVDGISGTIAQVPFFDGQMYRKSPLSKERLRLILEGLLDQLGSYLGLPPRLVTTIGPPGKESTMITMEDSDTVLAALNPDQHPFDNRVAARICLHLSSYRPIAVAHQIQTPLLVLVCKDDAVTPAAAGTKLVEMATQGELVQIPGSHFDIYRGTSFEIAVQAEIIFIAKVLSGS